MRQVLDFISAVLTYQTILRCPHGRRNSRQRISSIDTRINSLSLRQADIQRLASEVICDPFRRTQFPRRVCLRTDGLLASTRLYGATVLGWCFGDAEAVVASGRSGVADVAEVVVGAGGLRGSLDEVGWSDCRYGHRT